MYQLAILLRAAQLFAHSAHNLVAGPTFFADHPKLGELYAAYEEAYDAVIERQLGLGDKDMDLAHIQLKAATHDVQKLASRDAEANFTALLELERAICAEIKPLALTGSYGTQNLLQGLADDSEARQYQLRQRLSL